MYFCTIFRVRLSKRRVKDAPSSNSLLVVKHRELFDQESAMQVSLFIFMLMREMEIMLSLFD